MQPNATLDFVYFDAGGGHRSAAIALKAVVESLDYGWEVRLVNLQEVLDALDVFRKITNVRLEDVYNKALAKGWTLGSTTLLATMHGIIRLYHSAQVRLLTEYWARQQPDMVVSLVPNFNRALFQSLAKALPGVPLVTILTDFADYPPHFWIEKQEQYLICGTHRACQQARAAGYPKTRAFETSGMILRPEFYSQPPVNKAEERMKLGLHPDLPTAMVLFGGEGSAVMGPIAQRLGNGKLDLQLIMVCGKNQVMRKKLEAMKTRNLMFVEGFTKQIPYYMQLSDFFIGKPGPGSISEALKMQLPVIVERNAWTLPQERYNADWVLDQGVGLVLKNFRSIQGAVKDLLSNGQLQVMKARIADLNNQAVYEIPPILRQILMTH